MESLKKNNNILNTIILILFICISIFIGSKHEPWADEAQAWLIARDASVGEIIFKIAKYEGTPMLWHLLLKMMISFKLTYKYYYLIPIFFSSIGIYVILFKLKINNLYKVILPFTYFIGFEYTIKARNYSLILPILSIIAMIYEKRKEKIFLYNFFILLLAFVSLHAAIISGILFVFEIIEFIQLSLKKQNIKKIIKYLISFLAIVFSYIFIIYTVKPSSDVYVNIGYRYVHLSNIIEAILRYIKKFLEAFCLKSENFSKYGIYSLIFVLSMFFCILKKNKNKKLFIFLLFPLLAFMYLIRISNHHIGIIFYTFIFALYLVKDEINVKLKKVFAVLFFIILLIQSAWYFNSIYMEVFNDFSAGKRVSEYIKSLDYSDKKIYTSGYYSVSILPYFEKNIFCGERGKQTYYTWSINNSDWVKSSSYDYLYPDIIDAKPDIVILSDWAYKNKMGYSKLVRIFKQSKDYKLTHFKAKIIFKGFGKEAENEGFYVFERIE